MKKRFVLHILAACMLLTLLAPRGFATETDPPVESCGDGLSWSLDGSTKLFLAALALIMLALPFVLPSKAGALLGLLVWGIATFAIVPPVQMRVMQAAAEAPGLAASVNIGAFNLGNALGAAAGGAVISAGWGYASVSWAGAALAAAGLSLVIGGSRNARRLASA